MNEPRYKVGDILVNYSDNAEHDDRHFLIHTIGGDGKASGKPYFYDCLCVELGWTEMWWCHYVDVSQKWEKVA